VGKHQIPEAAAVAGNIEDAIAGDPISIPLMGDHVEAASRVIETIRTGRSPTSSVIALVVVIKNPALSRIFYLYSQVRWSSRIHCD